MGTLPGKNRVQKRSALHCILGVPGNNRRLIILCRDWMGHRITCCVRCRRDWHIRIAECTGIDKRVLRQTGFGILIHLHKRLLRIPVLCLLRAAENQMIPGTGCGNIEEAFAFRSFFILSFVLDECAENVYRISVIRADRDSIPEFLVEYERRGRGGTEISGIGTAYYRILQSFGGVDRHNLYPVSAVVCRLTVSLLQIPFHADIQKCDKLLQGKRFCRRPAAQDVLQFNQISLHLCSAGNGRIKGENLRLLQYPLKSG